MDAYVLVTVMCACTSRDLVTEGLGLFAVACHALLDGHGIAAEVRHEGLALLGLARDDARVGVVVNEQPHAAGCRAELLDRRLDLRARRLHREARPEAGHRRRRPRLGLAQRREDSDVAFGMLSPGPHGRGVEARLARGGARVCAGVCGEHGGVGGGEGTNESAQCREGCEGRERSEGCKTV